jgi:hypothetical protein
MASFVDQYFEGSNYMLSVAARSLVRSRSIGTITIALDGKKCIEQQYDFIKITSLYNVFIIRCIVNYTYLIACNITLGNNGSTNVTYVDGSFINFSGDIYFDAVEIDRYGFLNTDINQQSPHIIVKDRDDYISTLKIYGKQKQPTTDCIFVYENPHCYDITITGTILNVTDQVEIKLINHVYLNSNVTKNEIDLIPLYKMSISHVTLKHKVDNQSILVDLKDYLHVDDEDLKRDESRINNDEYNWPDDRYN